MRVEDSDQIVPLVTLDNGAYVAHEPTLQWLSEQREPFFHSCVCGKVSYRQVISPQSVSQDAAGQGVWGR